MLNDPVLVLNQNYEPLNICRARRAILLVMSGKAEVTEINSCTIRSPSFSIICPSVVRLAHMVKRPRPQVKLTRRRVFARDNYTCQYCGKQTAELTLDHIIPRHAGGEHSWENVVSACKRCNQRKAGFLPKDAGMRLLQKPSRPSNGHQYLIYPMSPPEEWQKYLPISRKAHTPHITPSKN